MCGKEDDVLDIQLCNAYPSLTLRSAFGMPSRWLRGSSKLLLAVLVR